MTFSLPVQPLRDALAKLSGVYSTHSNVAPVLTCVQVQGTGDALLLSITDLHRFMRVEVPCEGAPVEPLACVPYARWKGAVQSMPKDAEVSLSFSQGKLTLVCGSQRAVIQTMSADEFPEKQMPDLDSVSQAIPLSLGRVAYAASTNKAHYTINGVCLAKQEDGAWITGTNRHMVALVELLDTACPVDDPVLMPAAVANAVADMAERGEMEMRIADGWLHCAVPGEMFSAALVETQFPLQSVQQIRAIPDGHTQVSMDADELCAALALVMPVAAENTASPFAKLEFGGSLTVSADDGHGSTAEQSLEVERTDDAEISVLLNPAYLRDCVKHQDSERVTLWVSGERPVVYLEDGEFSAIMLGATAKEGA